MKNMLKFCPFVASLALIASEEPPQKKVRRLPPLVIEVPELVSTKSNNEKIKIRGEQVICSICGSKEISESITVDDITYGFCNHHTSYAGSGWRKLFPVKEEE